MESLYYTSIGNHKQQAWRWGIEEEGLETKLTDYIILNSSKKIRITQYGIVVFNIIIKLSYPIHQDMQQWA